MADSITWLLNADASQVRAEMERSVTSVGSATNRMIRDIDGVTSTHSNLLRSDHRVAASLRGLASEALNTGDAIATAGRGLESLAMATNVSLPALIGLEVVGTLIQKIAKAHEDAVKLDKELTAAGKPRDPKSKLAVAEDIAQRRAVVEKAKKDAEEKRENPWPTGTNWIRKAWNFINQEPDLDAIKNAGPGEARFARHPRPPSVPPPSDLEIEERKTKAAEEAADAIERQAEAEKLLAAEAKGMKERLQLSLADIAKEGVHRKTGAFDSGRQYAGDVAEEAIKEQGLARKSMLQGNFGEAIQHQSIAEQLKASIPALKDSEKIATFKSALDTSERLRAIEQKIGRELVNR